MGPGCSHGVDVMFWYFAVGVATLPTAAGSSFVLSWRCVVNPQRRFPCKSIPSYNESRRAACRHSRTQRFYLARVVHPLESAHLVVLLSFRRHFSRHNIASMRNKAHTSFSCNGQDSKPVRHPQISVPGACRRCTWQHIFPA